MVSRKKKECYFVFLLCFTGLILTFVSIRYTVEGYKEVFPGDIWGVFAVVSLLGITLIALGYKVLFETYFYYKGLDK